MKNSLNVEACRVTVSTEMDRRLDTSSATPAECALHQDFLKAFRDLQCAMTGVFYHLALIEESRTYKAFGFTCMSAYVIAATGLGRRTVREMLTLARRLRTNPALNAAVEAGEISWRKALLISRHAGAHDPTALVELARTLSTEQLRAALGRALEQEPLQVPGPVRPGPAGADTPKRDHDTGSNPPIPEKRNTRSPMSSDGAQAPRRRVTVDGRDDREASPIYIQLRLTREQFARWQNSVSATGPALIEQLLQALGGQETDQPSSLIVLLHCPSCGATTMPTSRGESEVDRALLMTALCDGVVEDTDLRRRSTIAPSRRREVLRRARYCCEAAGCSHQRWLDIHHRVPVSQGGRDDMDNLIALCRRCHHRLHEREERLKRRRRITVPARDKAD